MTLPSNDARIDPADLWLPPTEPIDITCLTDGWMRSTAATPRRIDG